MMTVCSKDPYTLQAAHPIVVISKAALTDGKITIVRKTTMAPRDLVLILETGIKSVTIQCEIEDNPELDLSVQHEDADTSDVSVTLVGRAPSGRVRRVSVFPCKELTLLGLVIAELRAIADTVSLTESYMPRACSFAKQINVSNGDIEELIAPGASVHYNASSRIYVHCDSLTLGPRTVSRQTLSGGSQFRRALSGGSQFRRITTDLTTAGLGDTGTPQSTQYAEVCHAPSPQPPRNDAARRYFAGVHLGFNIVYDDRDQCVYLIGPNKAGLGDTRKLSDSIKDVMGRNTAWAPDKTIYDRAIAAASAACVYIRCVA